jgi:hypothetical protein
MDNPEMIEMMIEMKLTTTNFYTRWPCHVCGGTTEKVNVLCEGHDARLAGEVRDNSVRVCEQCLRDGDIDGRLVRHAARLESKAAYLRTFIGRLKVPTYAEWQAYEKRVDVAGMASSHISERFAQP